MGGYTAADFLKKPKGKEASVREKKDEVAKPVRHQRTAQEEEDDFEDKFEAALNRNQRRAEKPLFSPGEEVTPIAVLAKLTEILGLRGRKGTSAADQMNILQRLRQEVMRAKLSLALEVKVLLQIIASHFDDPNSVSSHMNAIEWHA